MDAAADPSSAIPTSWTSWSWITPSSFTTLASGPASAPASARNVIRVRRADSAASRATSSPTRSRSVGAVSSSTSATSAPTPAPIEAPLPIDTRSFASVVRPARQPSSTAPITQSSGTNTSSKKTSLNQASPLISRKGRISIPGEPISTKKQVMPSWAGLSGEVRARQIPQSAVWAIEVQTFCPVRRHPSPSRTARIRSEARSEPASGSENSWHHMISCRIDGPIHRSCCSAVPCSISVGRAHAATWRWGRRTRAARNSWSITICSPAVAPRPHGTGQCGAR